jgi:molybdopterin-binding protein
MGNVVDNLETGDDVIALVKSGDINAVYKILAGAET